MCDYDPPTRGIPDRQQEEPWARCAWCGGEIYAGEPVLQIGYDYYHTECVTETVAGEDDP